MVLFADLASILNRIRDMNKPKSGSWTGWSVQFSGCRARLNEPDQDTLLC
jgi:hypothetical protein